MHTQPAKNRQVPHTFDLLSRLRPTTYPQDTLDLEILVRFVRVPFVGVYSMGVEIAEVEIDTPKPSEESSAPEPAEESSEEEQPQEETTPLKGVKKAPRKSRLGRFFGRKK